MFSSRIIKKTHLHPRRCFCGHRFEVTDDKSCEICAHLYTCSKLVLKQAIADLNCLDLKCTFIYTHCHTHWASMIADSMHAALTTGMLDREMYSGLLLIRTEKLALKLGSSKQGNAIRALVGSKWVEAKILKKSAWMFLLYKYGVIELCSKRMGLVSPGLSGAGSVAAPIEAIETFSKLCSKLNIQKVCLSSTEDPGRENPNLLMGGVMENWKNLQHVEMEKKLGVF